MQNERSQNAADELIAMAMMVSAVRSGPLD